MMAQKSGVTSETIIKMAEWAVSFAFAAKKVKTVWSNPVVKYGTYILIIAYLLKWFGFTDGLFFTKPF